MQSFHRFTSSFHPGVLPSEPLGMVKTLPMAPFLQEKLYPFLVDRKVASMQWILR